MKDGKLPFETIFRRSREPVSFRDLDPTEFIQRETDVQMNTRTILGQRRVGVHTYKMDMGKGKEAGHPFYLRT